MEKSDLSKMDKPNAPDIAAGVPLALTDPATGKVRHVREMTDQELERHAHDATGELMQCQQQLSQIGKVMADVTNQSIGVAAFRSIVIYEILRRRAMTPAANT